MSLVKAECRVDFPTDGEFAKWFTAQTDDVFREMAEDCEHYATMNVRNHTGNLQMSIKARKSKFKDGGWIVTAGGGGGDKGHHALLVEFGTQGPRTPLTKKLMKFEIDGQVFFARIVAPMPAKPFMGPARDRVFQEASRKLKQ